jgi:hypothetical protein
MRQLHFDTRWASWTTAKPGAELSDEMSELVLVDRYDKKWGFAPALP